MNGILQQSLAREAYSDYRKKSFDTLKKQGANIRDIKLKSATCFNMNQ